MGVYVYAQLLMDRHILPSICLQPVCIKYFYYT